MPKKIVARLLFPAVLMLTVSTPGIAIERMDGDSFTAACRAYGADAGEAAGSHERALCTAFLLGYFASAGRFYVEQDRRSSYHDRALDTRAYGLLQRNRKLKGKRYCIPENEPIEAIIVRINEMSPGQDKPEFADSIVEAVLDRHYQCPD